MKRLSKRSLKKLLSMALALCMVIINPMAVYAKADAGITAQQLSDLLGGTQEMIENLQELGFTMDDIVDMFAMSGNVEEQDLQLLYDMVELDNTTPLALYDYDGNPPASYQDQKQRIQNVYGVALRYYGTNYYEGNSIGGENFGKYLTYLYLSHYVDGPGRAPTANDLPYIISSSDVTAYNTFLNSAKLNTLFSGLASLGSACYSGFDYTQTVGNISNIIRRYWIRLHCSMQLAKVNITWSLLWAHSEMFEMLYSVTIWKTMKRVWTKRHFGSVAKNM